MIDSALHGDSVRAPLSDGRMTHFRPYRGVIFLSHGLCFAARSIFHCAEVIAAISQEDPLSFHYLIALSAFISFETTDAFNNTRIKS